MIEDDIEAMIGFVDPHNETIKKLIAEVRGLRADAERYRYLRHVDRLECLKKNGPAAGCWIDSENERGVLVLLTEEDADAAIDAARAAHPKEGV